MISVLAALVLVSPPAVEYIPDRRDLEHCTGQIVCPFTSSGRVCVCEGPVISLGSWDPREAPAEWSRSIYGTPASFGAYPTEQKSAVIRCYGAE